MKLILDGTPEEIVRTQMRLAHLNSAPRVPRVKAVRADIGNMVKKMREKAGLSEADFSTKLNIDIKRLNDIELGIEEITLDMADKAAEILNCNITDFLSGTYSLRNVEIY